ncbi:MAG: triosephosphate isomerase [Candidatus Doudnabacteria bacterium]|nr:triosephosphate isomerase [Candidatus Doudnabacteria bacterium]
MKKIIIANWKMNPRHLSEAVALLKDYSKLQIPDKRALIVCPQMALLPGVIDKFGSKFFWGAQNCFWELTGPYTGESSSATLKGLGVSHVLLGHSERRKYLGETDGMVRRKLIGALRVGLTGVVCLGGGLFKRTGEPAIKNWIKKQFLLATNGIRFDAKKIVLVYEPAWAISTFGAVPVSRRHIESMVGVLRKSLAKRFGARASGPVKVLYGGNVNGSNAAEIFSSRGLNGALVGAASLNKKEFSKILRAAN